MSNNNEQRNGGNGMAINYSEDVQKACMQAATIADLCNTNIITPMHMFWALTISPECSIQNYLAESGIRFDSVAGLDVFLARPDLFELVTKEKYPYAENSENEHQDEAQNEQSDDENSEDAHDVSEDCSEESSEDAFTKQLVEAIEEKTGEKPEDGRPINIVINVSEYPNEHPSVGITEEDLDIVYSETMLAIFRKTAQNCLNAKQNFIDKDNLFYQLLRSGDESLTILLEQVIHFETEDLLEYMSTNCKIYADYSEDTIAIPKALKNCCTVLNDKYRKGDECDILGRDEEVDLLWNIFSKKTKRNSILIGEPGVGKTAIMEALTMQIVNGTCPVKFRDYYVIELNLIGMVAGTKYRGEFEAKMEHLTTFLESTDNVILYIDEIHQMLGAGSAEGSMDMSGSMKPILARDNIILVGATTNREYNQILSRDGAFKRRFEVVEVAEPKHDKVKPMIRKRVETLMKYHQVEVSEEILDRVITLAYAFNTTTSNPDKTIDLLDRSMAKAAIIGDGQLEEKHIFSIFTKNYDNYSKQPNSINTSVAYHEAGHYVALRALQDVLNYQPVLVSIVPNGYNAGVTHYELPEYALSEQNMDYIKSEVIVLLAGRAAQQLFTKEYEAGAHSDLLKANKIIDQMLAEYGMLDGLDHLVVTHYGQNSDRISDTMLDELRNRKKELLAKWYDQTVEIVTKAESAIKRIVDLLLEKQIATAEELDIAYRGES